jgi:hypothetical protein
LVSRCDVFGGTLSALEKEGNKQDEYVCTFCDSLMCHMIFRISIRAKNFCSLLNCLNDGSSDNKKHLSSSISVSSIFFSRNICNSDS